MAYLQDYLPCECKISKLMLAMRWPIFKNKYASAIATNYNADKSIFFSAL